MGTNVANYWSTSVQQDVARAEQLLLQALDHDPNIARARVALGLLRRLHNRLEEARIELQKAIALAPHFAPAFWILGTTLILLGQPDAAILETEKGLRLSPSRAAVPIAYTILSQGHLLLGHVEQAVELARKACAGNPRLYFTHMCLAAALGLEGSLDEARAALAEAIKLRPEFDSPTRLRVLHLGQTPVLGVTRDNDRRGLRRAGMPDE